MENLEDIYQSAKSWILEAGKQLRLTMNQTITVKHKTSAADIVTQKDIEIEQFFVNKLQNTYPSHFLLGEEGTASKQDFDPKNEIVWIIDPIDGTTNFVHQGRNFCISLAVYEKGEARIGMIYDPISDELFHAKKGEGAYLNNQQLPNLTSTTLEEAVISINQLWIAPNEKINHQKLHTLVQKVRATRYLGSAALEMAYVACGRLDAYIDFRLSPWDIAGGLVILAEVGAEMTTVNGENIQLFTPSTTVFTNPSLYQGLLAYFSRN